MELDARGRRLRAALAFLRLRPTEPELRLLHRWLDTWNGVGLITVGVERHGMRLSMSHIADGEWRAVFMGENALLTPTGTAWRRRRGERCRSRHGRRWGLDRRGSACCC